MGEKKKEQTPELTHTISEYIGAKYQLNRGECQDLFGKFLLKNGFDGYGYYDGDKGRNLRGGYTNSTFEINPYYWGEDVTEMQKPNFIFFPKDIEIYWYKYPMRDPYASKELSRKQIKKMLKVCQESLDS